MNNANQKSTLYCDLTLEEINNRFGNKFSGQLMTLSELPKEIRRELSPNFTKDIHLIRKEWCTYSEDRIEVFYNGWLTKKELIALSKIASPKCQVVVAPAGLENHGSVFIVKFKINKKVTDSYAPVFLTLFDMGDESVGINTTWVDVEAPFQFINGTPQDEHDKGVAEDFKKAMVELYADYFDGKTVANYTWERDIEEPNNIDNN